MSALSQFYTDFKTKNREVALKAGEGLLRQLERIIRTSSLVGNSTFFDPDQFAWVKTFEDNWQVIRKELDEILKYRDDLPNFQDISPDQYNITNDQRWKTFFFYAYGVTAEQNCRLCPETAKLLSSIPGVKTAFFSILLPQKQIPPHRGPFNGVLRYHLGLIIPEAASDCGIRVGEDVRHWQEGKSLVFDDSFEHEAWNNTDEVRVVLFVDIVRPLKFPASLLNQFIIQLIAWSPYIKDAETNQKKWDQRLQGLFKSKTNS
ncbi:aspartyl/asparaginyl beta-hydroxylase domain-containing protein [Acaryochloris sp. CCMEE 5410]|uniref:aspartyl/asparaginyl beta-hydroxylase domain-containing protein n=1 Tax=Acaryochloris sp. CCMEE 5410 TaxID=310037 RepID=UPI0002483C68|nr:aspartyl/asparaginyl beta-hydroxylase domain-containing protein [Acaryochloris sp. CCMEE 5410]KAI9130689.1 aspartyl/asparaginyl beta-hydroxylase domain-containing protein [Acaryochloris sp. CCMEE 5410]